MSNFRYANYDSTGTGIDDPNDPGIKLDGNGNPVKTSNGLGVNAGTGARPSYLGQIATRTPLSNSTAGSNKQSNNESWHICWENVAAIGAMWAGGFENGGVEVPSGSPTVLTASVNYPFGTYTPFKFNGSLQGIIPNGGVLISDLLTLPTPLTVAQAFRIRSYQTNASGVIYNGLWGGPNDLFEFAASGVIDKTLGGTITNTAPGNPYVNTPVAIFGITTKGVPFLLGDSIISAVFSAESGIATSYADRGLGRIFGQRGMAYISGGVGSSTGSGFAASAKTIRMAQSQYASDVLCNFGTNDLGSVTGSALATIMTAIAAFFPGKKFYPATVLPRTTSTDSWATLANQTVLSPFETNRLAYNALVRAGISGCNGYMELADAFESDRDSGKIRVGRIPGVASGIANTNDGLHPFSTGYQVIADTVVMGPIAK